MATYAIGDIQGCFDTLEALLERCAFDPGADRVWVAGDLVNRGPRSLDVLRWARGLGDRAVCVLGNHDLHLLARRAGVGKVKRPDTLASIFKAPDCDELVSWLRHRPLLHREGGFVLVHAGLDPRWTVDEAASLAAEVEAAVRGDAWFDVLELEVERASGWSLDLAGPERLRSITAVLTRVRTVTGDGRLCSSFSGPPDQAPPGCHPWFEHPAGVRRDETVVFGHWAALGFQRLPGFLALDSGCVWGGALTAVRLEDGAVYQQPALE